MCLLVDEYDPGGEADAVSYVVFRDLMIYSMYL